MSIRKRNKKYWVDFQINGTRVRKSSPENTHTGAKAYEALLKSKIIKGENLDSQKSSNIPLFKDFIKEWLEIYVDPNNKPSEQRQKRLIIKKHLNPFFGHLSLNKISTLDIEKFKLSKRVDGLKNKSINNVLGVLGKCLRTALDWEKIDKIPKIKYLKVAQKDINYLTVEEQTKLLKATKGDNLFNEMLLFSLRTGVRIGELTALEWKDIDFQNEIVTVDKNIVNGILGTPKNGKSRKIPLTKDILSKLKLRKKENGLLFYNSLSEYISRFSCRNKLKAACIKTGINIISWHGLRHSFASQLVTNGVPLKAIQELLGHSDLKMVQRYAHLESSALKEAIKTLNNSDLEHDCHKTVTIPITSSVLERARKQPIG